MANAQRRAAVIGAGICGLNCARHLDLAGWEVDVFEKSRGLGGRLAAKRIDGLGSVDLGAQFMTAQTPEFRALLQTEGEAGRVAIWKARIAYLGTHGIESATLQERWIGVPGMNSWLESVWPRSRVNFNCRVERLTKSADKTWRIDDRPEPYDCVILAIPPAQAAALAAHTDLEASLTSVAMNPCWAALAVFEAPVDLGYDAAFVRVGGLDWISANHTKPGRTIHPAAWTLHAGPLLSRQILELPEADVTPHLLEALATALGSDLPKVRIALTHRWRFASPASPGADGVLWSGIAGLGAGGDWAVGGRVEGAFTAGRLLAQKALSTFS